MRLVQPPDAPNYFRVLEGLANAFDRGAFPQFEHRVAVLILNLGSLPLFAATDETPNAQRKRIAPPKPD